MYKVALIMLAVVLAFGFAGQAVAADGNVSNGMLADMGLSGIQTMSDTQGDQIRGKGYASVWGGGYAAVHGAASANGYVATSSNHHSSSLAAGANLSVAISRCKWAAAGGFSVAYAK